MRAFLLAVVAIASVRNPGAGMDGAKAFESVYKDGFSHIGCMADKMNLIADFHGDNKMSYQIKTNVSVIRYKEKVDGDAQEKVSPRVCFDFCRTIPDMGFFGLIHGRECYCTPYYQKTTGSGTCDLMCEGDGSVTCGGNEMTDMYEMHGCDDTKATLTETMKKAKSVGGEASQLGDFCMEWANKMETSANALMATATMGGDMDSNNYGQAAKVYSGKTKHIGEAAKTAGTDTLQAEGEAALMEGKDFSIAANAFDADEAVKKLKSLSEAAQKSFDAAEPFALQVYPQVEQGDAKSAIKTFEPIGQTVERWALLQSKNATAPGKQTTCAGEMTSEPMVGLGIEECAQACYDAAPKSSSDYCVAFQHYTVGTEEPLCFLLKAVDRVWAFTCASQPVSFLQKDAVAKVQNECFARHTWGAEAPRKPEVNKVNRCFGDDSTALLQHKALL